MKDADLRALAKGYLHDNFPQAVGFKEEERLLKLLKHVQEKGKPKR